MSCPRSLRLRIQPLLLILLAAGPLPAQESLMTGELEGGVVALEVQEDVDRRLLTMDRQRYQELLRRQRTLGQELNRLYTQLDGLYQRLVEGDLQVEEAMDLQSGLEELEQQLQRKEQERDSLRAESARVRERMREKGLRITLLAGRLDALRSASVSRRGPLTGRWKVTILPSNVEGQFVLRQEGTLISGRYSISPDRRGSFTGTVIGNRVTLNQVDATYGKDGVFYGTVSADGNRIEGSWESLSLGTGRPSFGIWKAGRAAEGEEPEQAEPPPASQQEFENPSRRTPLPQGP